MAIALRPCCVVRGCSIVSWASRPPPPPPGVVTDLSVHVGDKPSTVRQRLENHRENPTCKGCHGLIDPPGLALENFDVTGKWREVDALSKIRSTTNTELLERTGAERSRGPASLSHAASGPVPDDRDQAPDDVRAQSRDRVLRHAPGAADRA